MRAIRLFTITALLLSVALPTHSAPPCYTRFGDYLAATGHRQDWFMRSIDHRMAVSKFNASVPYLSFPETRESFFGRYGYYNEGWHDGRDPTQAGLDINLFSAGDAQDERGVSAPAMLMEAARDSSNPFNLCDNVKWTPNPQDVMDLLKVRDLTSPQLTVFDGLLRRTLDKIHVVVPAPPVVIPPPVKPPIVAPPPVAPPPRIKSAPVCMCPPPSGWSWFYDSQLPSTGRLDVVLLHVDANGKCPPCPQ